MVSGGYAGKVLRINLTTGRIGVSPLDEGRVKLFLGGRGLAARVYYDEVGPAVRPLAPDNVLVFFTGPLTGTPAPATTKIEVVTRSPETGFYLCSNGGGHFGPHLKLSGYDGLILEGKASRPCYIAIEDDSVSIRDARDLWGMKTTEVNATLADRHGTRTDQVVSAGPAAERGVVISCLQIGDRSIGRGGVGAVLASKNVKALVARGTGQVKIADPERFQEAARKAAVHSRETKATHHKYGTAQYTGPMNELGAYSARNFQTGVFAGYEKITAEALKSGYFTRNKGCYRCPVACAQYCEVREGKFKGAASDPEYETIGTLGGQCGVSDLAAIIAGNMLCDEYGVDTMSVGTLIALGMELFERGVITKRDTGGIELVFGNAEAMVEMITATAERRHFGDLIAAGMRGMEERFPAHRDIMMHVKGLPLAAYDPRGFYGNALTYGTSNRGACHNVGGWSIRAELITKEYDRFSVDGKGRLIKELQDTRAYVDSLGICTVVRSGYGFTERPHGQVLEYLTGLDLTPELMTIGERIYSLERLLLVREGCGRKDDMLPGRLMKEPLPEGQAKGHVLDEAKYNRMLDDYYSVRGWDSEGRPTPEKLALLGLADL
jgi:aldehyde:ferredoxin oxidoreductase